MRSTLLQIGLWLLVAEGTLGCPQPQPMPDAPCAYDGAEPTGIALTVSVHYRSFDQGDLEAYERVAEEVDWVADWAETYGLTLELAYNGYQAEASTAAGEEERLEALAAAGHGFGVHHHPTVYDAPLTWIDLGGSPSDTELQQSVDDHRGWIGFALDPLGIDYPGGHVRLTGRTAWWAGMMEDAGYTTETVEQWSVAATGGGGGSFDVLHPFRWAACDPCPELIHDPDVPYVAIPQHPQVGRIAGGDHLDFDGTVPHLKTTLLLAHLEWRAATLAGDPPRVWAYGVTIHPEQGADQNDDLERFAQFAADHFLDPVDERIGRSACAAPREEVRAWHEAWEADHASEASFEWRPGDAYPYRLPQLERVYDDHLVAIHDDELDRGVRIAELENSSGGTALLAWADLDEGEQVQVDLSGWLEGAVSITDSVGTEESPNPRSVAVGREPVVVEGG